MTPPFAASLPVGSGAKIQANAGNITSNTNLINSSGNKAYDTATAASLPIGSGSKIQVNTANISTNATAIIASGNANHASIATNTSNISTNTTAINASGNSNKDLITANTTAINASGNSNKDYVAAVSGYAVAYTDISITDAGGYSNWKIADGTAAGDAISNGETLNVSGVSGVNTDYTGNLLKIAAVGLSGYSQSYTDIKVAALVDSAPDTLNTLNEIAAAIDDDANIATTLTNLIVSLEMQTETWPLLLVTRLMTRLLHHPYLSVAEQRYRLTQQVSPLIQILLTRLATRLMTPQLRLLCLWLVVARFRTTQEILPLIQI